MEKFTKGTVRGDGRMFWGYQKRYGKVEEKWVKPESFAKMMETARRCARKNPNKALYQAKWAALNPEKAKESKRKSAVKYRLLYPEKAKQCREKTRAKSRESYKVRRKEDPAVFAAEKMRHATWRKRNPEKAKERVRKWRESKRGCPLYRLGYMARNSVFRALRDNKKAPSLYYIGCDVEFLKVHIETQFSEGMSWDNYGEWHVDHRVPLASAAFLEELIPLLHFSNLQPLWAFENQSKGARFDWKLGCT